VAPDVVLQDEARGHAHCDGTVGQPDEDVRHGLVELRHSLQLVELRLHRGLHGRVRHMRLL
jgi:hypothetical protein